MLAIENQLFAPVIKGVIDFDHVWLLHFVSSVLRTL